MNNEYKDIDWSEPSPIIPQDEPQDYPLDALPKIIRDAVIEVKNYTQAPTALIASSALAAVSLALQSHIDVARSECLYGPTGLYFLTIAESGERKSTCDSYFTSEIRKHDEAQSRQSASLLSEYHSKCQAWETKKNGLLDKLRAETKKGADSTETELMLAKLDTCKPVEPKLPTLLYSDFTPEALAYNLSKWPSAGILTAEAGTVFGSHGMNKDSIMRHLAQLNVIWDGGSLKVNRRTSESFVVQSARLTQHLQIQQSTLNDFLERSGSLARGMGYFARFLISKPATTQGTRLYTEPPKTWDALSLYNNRIAEILALPIPFNAKGTLTPIMMKLSDEAKDVWILLNNLIEAKLADGCEYSEIRDVASKASDNVARLAAAFQSFENGAIEISMDNLLAAGRIIMWHLNEAKRFFIESGITSNLRDAPLLDNWLISHCKAKSIDNITTRDISRLISPVCLRNAKRLQDPLSELEEANRIKIVTQGQRKIVYINPKLLR